MKKSKKKLEIVMLSEVENLGKKGEIIRVAKGYAINYLIPQDLAVLRISPQAEKILKQKEEEDKKKEAEIKKAQEGAEKLAGLTIEIKAKIGKTGKLFGSVTKIAILKEIRKKTKLKLGKIEVIGDLPIKKMGEYILKLKLAPNIEPEIKVRVSGAKKIIKKNNKKNKKEV